MDLQGKTWAWNLGFSVKEVVFSASFLPGGESFCQTKYTFTADFLLIGKYLLADSLHGGWAASLSKLGLLRERRAPSHIYLLII